MIPDETTEKDEKHFNYDPTQRGNKHKQPSRGGSGSATYDCRSGGDVHVGFATKPSGEGRTAA